MTKETLERLITEGLVETVSIIKLGHQRLGYRMAAAKVVAEPAA